MNLSHFRSALFCWQRATRLLKCSAAAIANSAEKSLNQYFCSQKRVIPIVLSIVCSVTHATAPRTSNQSSAAIQSPIGLPDTRIEASHNCRDVSNFVSNHTFCCIRNSDEHRRSNGNAIRIFSSFISTPNDIKH